MMMKLRRMGIGFVLLGSGIVAGSVLFSTRGDRVFGAQGERPAARVTALIQVDPPGASSIEGRGPLTTEAISRDLRTRMELLRSRKLLNQVLAVRQVADLPSVKRQKDATWWLARNLVIENLNDTSLLRVGLAPGSGATPEEQARIINVRVDHVINQERREEDDHLESRQEWLQSEFKKRSFRLRDLRNVLDSRRQKIMTTSTERIPKQTLAQYALELRRKQLDLALERVAAEAALERRKDTPGANQAGSDERARLEDRIAALRAQEKVLREETESIDKALARLDDGESESLERLNDTIHRDLTACEKLEERLEELALDSNRQPSRIRSIDQATAP
jgi:hypothetical protein